MCSSVDRYQCAASIAKLPIGRYATRFWSNLNSPQSRAFLEKLMVPHLVKKHSSCLEPNGSLSCSQEIVTPTLLVSLWYVVMLPFQLRLGLPSSLSPLCCPTKTQYAPLLSPYVLHATPISSSEPNCTASSCNLDTAPCSTQEITSSSRSGCYRNKKLQHVRQ